MISAQDTLERMTWRVCRLICCDAALLVIDCPVPALRHPLLTLFPSTTLFTDRSYGSGHLASLMSLEPVRAASDIACQRGEVQYLSPSSFREWELVKHIAIVPLSSAAGTLGYLLLANSLEFSQGEDSLLHDYCQHIQPEIEAAVRALLLACLVRELRCIRSPSTVDMGWHQLPEALNSISIVSHELRTPLAAIKGYAGLLQAYSITDAEQEASDATTLTSAHQQHYLDMIMEETRHLEELIADLLDASRMQSGKLSLRLADVDIGEACQSAARRARQYIEQRHQVRPHLVECVVTPHLPPISADANSIQHILKNLLDNAVKYSPRGGKVELKADSITLSPKAEQGLEQQVVRIVVRDQGIGIPPEQRARLFQPFSRIDHLQVTQAQSVEGIGLGLYITQQLVEAMHGTINIDSQVGHGTEVTVCFPVESKQLVDNASLSVLQSGIAPQLARTSRQ